MIGVFDIVGTVGSGWLTDRFDPRKLLLVYYGFRGLALLALPVAFDSRYAALVGFAVVYGLDWVATVPPTSALATSTFPQHAGVVFAWIFSAHQFGAATAAWAAGHGADDDRRVHGGLGRRRRARPAGGCSPCS